MFAVKASAHLSTIHTNPPHFDPFQGACGSQSIKQDTRAIHMGEGENNIIDIAASLITQWKLQSHFRIATQKTSSNMKLMPF